MFNTDNNNIAFSYSSELDPVPLFNSRVLTFDRNWLHRHRVKSFAKLGSRGSGGSYVRKMSSLRAVNVRPIIKCMRGNRSCRAPRRLRAPGRLLHHAALIERAHLRCRQLLCFCQSLRKSCETARDKTPHSASDTSRRVNANFNTWKERFCWNI